MAVGKEEFREALAGLCTPVTVVTTMVGGDPAGATVSAIASLSLEPPMVTVALDQRSRLLPALLQARRFGVNVLSYGQEETARLFATPGAERFGVAAWQVDHGMPRLHGAGAWLVCEVTQAVPGGDHTLLLAAVEHTAHTQSAPLVYARRTFGTHSRFRSVATPGEGSTTTDR